MTKKTAKRHHSTRSSGKSATDSSISNHSDKVRIDKWLWSARFFRTRNLAKKAIEGGKVHIGGQRVKTSKEVSVGDVITIRQGSATSMSEKTVVVQGLSEQRGNATLAQTLCQETEESIARREYYHQQRKLANLARPDKYYGLKMAIFPSNCV